MEKTQLAVTQHMIGDFTSALQSEQRALAIRIKLFGEEHRSTADSYRQLGVTQHMMGDFTSTLQSHQWHLLSVTLLSVTFTLKVLMSFRKRILFSLTNANLNSFTFSVNEKIISPLEKYIFNLTLPVEIPGQV